MMAPKDVRKHYPVTPRQLCYWRKLGLLIPSSRTRGGHYRYHTRDLERLARICKLREAGFSTHVIPRILEALE